MGIGDAAHLAANSLDQLGTALSCLRPDRSGYITAEEYERITGEELDEFLPRGVPKEELRVDNALWPIWFESRGRLGCCPS